MYYWGFKNQKIGKLILTNATLYIAENFTNNSDKISKVKIIFKKIKMIPQIKKEYIINFF